MVVTFLLIVVLANEGCRLPLYDLQRVILPWRGLLITPVKDSGPLSGRGKVAPPMPVVGGGS